MWKLANKDALKAREEELLKIGKQNFLRLFSLLCFFFWTGWGVTIGSTDPLPLLVRDLFFYPFLLLRDIFDN